MSLPSVTPKPPFTGRAPHLRHLWPHLRDDALWVRNGALQRRIVGRPEVEELPVWGLGLTGHLEVEAGALK